MQKLIGLLYSDNWLSSQEYQEILDYLLQLWPIWEMRYSKHHPPPKGQDNRSLLRPVYWLGNWQFACLNYYHPPKGIDNRCVHSDPYPSILKEIVRKMERIAKEHFAPRDLPFGWQLNTCLVNYYGDMITDEKAQDCARVGEHKDFEPGPVASLSFGERALFQFVSSASKDQKSQVVTQQWLDNNSLQIFGGDKYKKKLFHRVQRVDRRDGYEYKLNGVNNFVTRRINLTFRYVPREHIKNYFELPKEDQLDTREYVNTLAKHSPHFEYVASKSLERYP